MVWFVAAVAITMTKLGLRLIFKNQKKKIICHVCAINDSTMRNCNTVLYTLTVYVLVSDGNKFDYFVQVHFNSNFF